jgi:glycosyltransferase involved in cell wall biosynthesis
MHICFLMPHHWSSSLGGAELQVRYFIEYIKGHTSHQVSMICCNSAVTDDVGVPIHRSHPFLPIRKYSLVADYPSVRMQLARLAPDVVYTRTSTPLVGFAARYCKKHSRTLVYHIAHASDVSPPREKGRRAFLKKLQRPIYEYGLKRAQIIIAQAEYQVAALQDNYDLTATAIIPNFHPIPDLVPSPKREFQVLWVANLKPAKKPELFIELAKRFTSKANVHFVMVGAVQDSAYEYLLDQRSLPENLTYLGSRSIEEVNRVFADADVFINTSGSDGEGFPNTFIQAWLHEVPVLSLELDPDSMMTTHGIGKGCHGDIKSLQEALAGLLGDDTVRIAMGRKARDYAVAHFGEKNCETLLRLIESNAA